MLVSIIIKLIINLISWYYYSCSFRCLLVSLLNIICCITINLISWYYYSCSS